MPFWEHSLFHKRFSHARPAAAAAIWASEGTTSKTRCRLATYRITPFSTQDSLCAKPLFYHHPWSSMLPSTQASAQSGLATPNGHVQQSHVSIRGKCARPVLHRQASNRETFQVQSCILSRSDFALRQFQANTRPMRILQEKMSEPIVQAPWSPKVMAPWEQMADLLPILQLRFQKQGLCEWNVFIQGPAALHHEILKKGTGQQGSPRSLPTIFKVEINFPSPQRPHLALLGQVDGSFLVARQDGNVQQSCHRLRGPAEGKLHVTAAQLQHGTGEWSRCCLLCCWNGTNRVVYVACNKGLIPIFHPNAFLHRKGPTAVVTCVPTLAVAISKWTKMQRRISAAAEWSKLVVVFQDATFHTAQCQCRSGVDETEAQAKVEQMHHAPLRWQQLTQFLLVWSLGGLRGWENWPKNITDTPSAFWKYIIWCCLCGIVVPGSVDLVTCSQCMYTVSICILGALNNKMAGNIHKQSTYDMTFQSVELNTIHPFLSTHLHTVCAPFVLPAAPLPIGILWLLQSGPGRFNGGDARGSMPCSGATCSNTSKKNRRKRSTQVFYVCAKKISSNLFDNQISKRHIT